MECVATRTTSEGSEEDPVAVEGLPMMIQPEDPWPQQLNSGGIRDDPPFSQLPYAPRCGLALRPDAAAAGDGHQSGSDATSPRLKRSANTFVGSPLASPIKWVLTCCARVSDCDC